MARLNIDQFTSFFVWYKDLPHQRLAVAELWKKMPVSLLEDDADWIQTYRDPAVEEDPEVPIVSGKDRMLSWGSCLAMAKLAGAKFPEVAGGPVCVGVRLVRSMSPVTTTSSVSRLDRMNRLHHVCTTQEWNGSKMVTIQDKFKDFGVVPGLHPTSWWISGITITRATTESTGRSINGRVLLPS